MSATLPAMKTTTSTTPLNEAMVAHILAAEERMAALSNQVLALNMVIGSFSQRLIGLEREVAELRQALGSAPPPVPGPTNWTYEGAPLQAGHTATGTIGLNMSVAVDGDYNAPGAGGRDAGTE